MVGANGTWYDKAGSYKTKPPHRLGGNLVFIDPPKMDGKQRVWEAVETVSQVQMALTNYKYAILGGSNSYSNAKHEEDSLLSHCSETHLAVFLLALEPGAFLLCNGWSDEFALPLGAPLAPAAQDPSTGEWSRSFAGGTSATWKDGQGKVIWATTLALV